MWVITFCLGIAWSLVKTQDTVLMMFLIIVAQFTLKTSRSIILTCMYSFILGWVWGYWHEKSTFPQLDHEPTIWSDVLIEGTVASIPKTDRHQRQFEFNAKRIDHQPYERNIWITCYRRCPAFQVGQKWKLKVDLRRPTHSALATESNPVAWMKSHHIHYFGQIKKVQEAHRYAQSSRSWWLEIFRYHLAQDIQHTFGNSPHVGLVQGLTLGLAHQIQKQDWDLFRRTGTTHLVVISGEHIGLVAGVAWSLVRWLWVRGSVFNHGIPAQMIASYFAWIVACFYAVLTGLGPPMERGILAYGIYLMKYMGHYRGSWLQSWRAALFLIILFEPHAILTPGLYLSFLAVLILVLMGQRFHFKGWRQTLALQTACLLGLSPLSLYAFSYTSLNGFFINLLAIPWIGWLLVPSAFMALVMNECFPWEGWWWPTQFFCSIFYFFLRFMDRFQWLNIETPLKNIWALLSISIGLGLLILMPYRRLFCFYLLLITAPFGSHWRESPPSYHAKFTMFQVGHGLAILIQTQHHVLLYDTGGKIYPSSDFARQKIIPWLKHQGIHLIDALIISRRRQNHVGGLASLQHQAIIHKLWTHDPNWLPKSVSCEQQAPWSWDGVKFEFIHLPDIQSVVPSTGCVLKIVTKTQQILIPGDLNERQERYLVQHNYHQLQATHMIIPNHGEYHSSSKLWLEAVHPLTAYLSTSSHHHLHLPHRRLIRLYLTHGIPVKNTSEEGSIQFDF